MTGVRGRVALVAVALLLLATTVPASVANSAAVARCDADAERTDVARAGSPSRPTPSLQSLLR